MATELAMPKLGSGARFRKLSASLAAKGAKNPDALAAYIGRKKYGAKKFGGLSAHGHTASGAAELLLAGREPYTVHAGEDLKCPDCGKMNEPDAKYCDQCGAKIPDDVKTSNQPGQALEFARRTAVTNPGDIIVTRNADGTATIRHRTGGDKIGDIRRDPDSGQWLAILDATGKPLAPRTHQRAALMDLVGTHNRGIASLRRPGETFTEQPLQPKPVQTELMRQYNIPAVSTFATPATSSASGPRMTGAATSGSDGGDKSGGLNPKGQAIYKKLRGRGFPHERALSFAKRAQSMGGRK